MDVEILYGLLIAVLCVLLAALVTQLAYRHGQRRLARETAEQSPPLETVVVSIANVEESQVVRVPRVCMNCGEFVHPALISGHLEVCRLRQQQQQQQQQPQTTQRPPSPASSSSSEQLSSDDTTCVICLSKRRTVAFVPCGHWTCCKACAKQVECCPLCRNDITQYLLVSGETVNKCPVCSLQIHHTFYTSHREVCRIQMKMREERKKEEEEAGLARQASIVSMKEIQSDDAKCCVCLKKPREVAFSPCGHWSTCTDCAEGIKKCPICNTEIAKSLTIYA